MLKVNGLGCRTIYEARGLGKSKKKTALARAPALIKMTCDVRRTQSTIQKRFVAYFRSSEVHFPCTSQRLLCFYFLEYCRCSVSPAANQ